MREIKFRVWNDYTNEMRYTFEGFTNEFDVLNLTKFFNEENYLTLLQFTGLQDVNGKDIYEGDIVELDKKIYYISFDLGSFCMTQKFEYAIFPFTLAEFEADEIQRIKIIGNIYENPELLELGREKENYSVS